MRNTPVGYNLSADRLISKGSGARAEAGMATKNSMFQKTIFIVAPGGAVGGGMGRVKDYMLEASLSPTPYRFEALITRDDRGHAFSLLLVMRAILRIGWAAMRGRAALVHVHFGDKGSSLRKSLVILGARLFGVKTILHLHTTLQHRYAAGGALYRFALRLPFLAASSIIALGKDWRDWLVETLKLPPEKIDILYNGVPVAAPESREKHESPSLVFIGNYSRNKGAHDIITALGMIKAAHPRLKAVLAGGGDSAPYQAMAGKNGTRDIITFKGWLDQEGVQAAILAADILVLPSCHEVLPLVILEALGLGTPVLCTPVGVIPEVLRDGETALFTPPGNPERLSMAIARLLEDDALRQRLSQNGMKLFAEKFSLDAFHANLFTLYHRRYLPDLVIEPSQRNAP